MTDQHQFHERDNLGPTAGPTLIPDGSGSLWSDERGDSHDVVVLVHGAMDRAASFARVVGQLRDRTTIRYDRRGYGRSLQAGTVPGATLDRHTDDLLALVGERPAVIAGHSLGGLIAMQAAIRRPEVIRAVLVFEAPLSWVPWWPTNGPAGEALQRAKPLSGAGAPADSVDLQQLGDASERFLRAMIGDDRWESLPAGAKAARRAEGPALVAELASARTTPVPLDQVAVPVVVARGDRSADRHQRAANEVAAGFGVEVQVIEGASHRAQATHPERFAELVRHTFDLAVAAGR